MTTVDSEGAVYDHPRYEKPDPKGQGLKVKNTGVGCRKVPCFNLGALLRTRAEEKIPGGEINVGP
jgi:hypothetical protein